MTEFPKVKSITRPFSWTGVALVIGASLASATASSAEVSNHIIYMADPGRSIVSTQYITPTSTVIFDESATGVEYRAIIISENGTQNIINLSPCESPGLGEVALISDGNVVMSTCGRAGIVVRGAREGPLTAAYAPLNAEILRHGGPRSPAVPMRLNAQAHLARIITEDNTAIIWNTASPHQYWIYRLPVSAAERANDALYLDEKGRPRYTYETIEAPRFGAWAFGTVVFVDLISGQTDSVNLPERVRVYFDQAQHGFWMRSVHQNYGPDFSTPIRTVFAFRPADIGINQKYFEMNSMSQPIHSCGDELIEFLTLPDRTLVKGLMPPNQSNPDSHPTEITYGEIRPPIGPNGSRDVNCKTKMVMHSMNCSVEQLTINPNLLGR